MVSVGVPAYGSVHTDRVNAFKDTMTKEFPKIKIAKEVGAENSSKEAGLKIMSDLLNAEKHIDAVFTIDDELSIGVLQAISENKRKDIKVETGAGGAQEYFNEIKKGGSITLASFLYSPIMVKDAVKFAVGIMNGKTPDQKAVINPGDRRHQGQRGPVPGRQLPVLGIGDRRFKRRALRARRLCNARKG